LDQTGQTGNLGPWVASVVRLSCQELLLFLQISPANEEKYVKFELIYYILMAIN